MHIAAALDPSSITITDAKYVQLRGRTIKRAPGQAAFARAFALPAKPVHRQA
ncbi:MAG TPA: hypothetical protein VF761_16000 [Gemmatimonadaceae bacterium]